MAQADISDEVENFVDHHLKKGSCFADWHAAWRTWCRNWVKFKERDGDATAGDNGGAGGIETDPVKIRAGHLFYFIKRGKWFEQWGPKPDEAEQAEVRERMDAE